MKTDIAVKRLPKPRIEMPKRCKDCDAVKPSSEFYSAKSNGDGLSMRCIPCSAIYDRRPEMRFSRARALARGRGHIWELTLEEYLPIIQQGCAYCGWPVEGTASGVDRIKPDLGYVVGNCAPACCVCNPLKGANFTQSEAYRLGAVVKEIRAERKAAGLPQPEAGMPKSFNVKLR